MSAENPHRENSGVMFFNSPKWIEQKPGRPALGGECTVGGKRYRVAAWIKELPDGREFFSLSFAEPKPQEAKGGAS